MPRVAEERRTLSGMKISRGSPSISYILFADDTLIFCKVGVAEATTILRILEDYELASGQKVDMGKCVVSFEKRTRIQDRSAVLEVLNMVEVQDQGKYLRLPSHIGRTNKEVFRFVCNKVEERVKEWKGKLLSQAVKEVLIKYVALTIPNYVMN
ncbi:hypothetical protein LIER_40656 [Lithospermum erythrorhizon]|uniref:Reverse transcriptase n=1 Tax=Lithospermum erythrorhizon TaxID=34254 RepID=A0AAV3QYW8_LITER